MKRNHNQSGPEEEGEEGEESEKADHEEPDNKKKKIVDDLSSLNKKDKPIHNIIPNMKDDKKGHIKFAPFYNPRLGKKKKALSSSGGNSSQENNEDYKVTVCYRKDIDCLFMIQEFVSIFTTDLYNTSDLLNDWYSKGKFDNGVVVIQKLDEKQKVPSKQDMYDKAETLIKMSKEATKNMAKCITLERSTILSVVEIELCRYLYTELLVIKYQSLLYACEICTYFGVELEDDLIQDMMELKEDLTQAMGKNDTSSLNVPYAMGIIINTNIPYSVKRDSKIWFKIKVLHQCYAEFNPSDLSIKTTMKDLKLTSLSLEGDYKKRRYDTFLLSCSFGKGSRSAPLQLEFLIEVMPILKDKSRLSNRQYFNVNYSDFVVVHTNDVQASGTECKAFLARMDKLFRDDNNISVSFPLVINKIQEYMGFKINRKFLLPLSSSSLPEAKASSSSSAPTLKDTSNNLSTSLTSENNTNGGNTSVLTQQLLKEPTEKEKITATKVLMSVPAKSQEANMDGNHIIIDDDDDNDDDENGENAVVIGSISDDDDNSPFNSNFLTPYEISFIHEKYFSRKERVYKKEIESLFKVIFATTTFLKDNSQMGRLWRAGYIITFIGKDVASALAKKFDASVISVCLEHSDFYDIASPSGEHYIIRFGSKRNPEEIILETTKIQKILKIRTKKFASLDYDKDKLDSLDDDFFLPEDKKNLFFNTHHDLPCEMYEGYVLLE